MHILFSTFSVFIFVCAIEKFEIPINQSSSAWASDSKEWVKWNRRYKVRISREKTYIECSVKKPSYALTLCFRLLSIRHRHNLLCPPILKVKCPGDETRFSGHQLQTKRKRQLWRPYGGRIIFRCSDQEPWPGGSPTVYTSNGIRKYV